MGTAWSCSTTLSSSQRIAFGRQRTMRTFSRLVGKSSPPYLQKRRVHGVQKLESCPFDHDPRGKDQVKNRIVKGKPSPNDDQTRLPLHDAISVLRTITFYSRDSICVLSPLGTNIMYSFQKLTVPHLLYPFWELFCQSRIHPPKYISHRGTVVRLS